MFESLINFLNHGLTHASGWEIFFYTLIVTHITIVSVTLFLHRTQAHRALDLHPIISHFFRFWLWLTTSMVTKEWTAVHRKHHARCETEEDPHSPITKGLKTVFWKGVELYRLEAKNTETLEKYGYGTPDDWMERNIYSRFSWEGVALMLIINLLLFGVIGLTVWAVQMLWIPIHAAGIINGVGHYVGYRNYDSPDASTNIIPFGIIIGGEELHNNHHTFASSAKFSSKWYEFDIGWFYICILEKLNLAKIKKVAPTPKLAPVKTVVDQLTLESVIANRYEIMTRYTKMLKKLWHQELKQLTQKTNLDHHFFQSIKEILQSEPTKLQTVDWQLLKKAFEYSQSLQVMHQMRTELSEVWGKSHHTCEQLIQKLQNWCYRAEKSGIIALQDFASQIKRYV